MQKPVATMLSMLWLKMVRKLFSTLSAIILLDCNLLSDTVNLILSIFPALVFFSVITKMIIEKRPWLASEETNSKDTPMKLAVIWDKIDVLQLQVLYC
jgi:hypothetical protein